MKQSNQQRVQSLLRWDELQYGQFMYQTGLAYLQAYIPDDDISTRALGCSRIFWRWWKNHWAQRDEQFLQRVNIYAPTCGMVRYYRFHNDAVRLVKCIYPNSIVLHDSYAAMIGEFNDEIIQKIPSATIRLTNKN